MCHATASRADVTVEKKRREKALVDEEIRHLKAQIVELRAKLPQPGEEVMLSSRPQCIRIVNVPSSAVHSAHASAIEQRQRLRMAKIVGQSLGIGNTIVEAQARLPPVLTAVKTDLWTNRVQRSVIPKEREEQPMPAKTLFLDCIRVRGDLGTTLSSCAPHRRNMTRPVGHPQNESLPICECEITMLSPPNMTRLSRKPPAYVPRRSLAKQRTYTAADSICCSVGICSAGRILPCLRPPLFESALL